MFLKRGGSEAGLCLEPPSLGLHIRILPNPQQPRIAQCGLTTLPYLLSFPDPLKGAELK